MKLGLNAVGLYPGKIGGAEQYIRNMVHALSKQDDMELYLFLNEDAYHTFDQYDNIVKCEVKVSFNIETQLTRGIDLYNLDAWFCPLFHLNPPSCMIPSVVAVFDIQQDYFPQNFSWKERKVRKKNMQETLAGADILLTISNFSKQTMMDKYGVNSDLIRVTYLDADENFYRALEPHKDEKVRLKYDLPEAYIFYPANSWPHKNHFRLIKAYNKLKKEKSFAPKLVLTGAQKQSQKKINNYIKRNGLEHDVIYLGYVAQEDLPYIFANAEMMVFPSLFEGFGIPLLEAMRTNTPIACSRCGSIPEIAGEAAVYFDAYSSSDIADKIHMLHENFKDRALLVQKGAEQVKSFSWEKCAEQTIAAIQSVRTQDKEDKAEIEPLVSIVTPSYNQGKFIEETIQSVLNQDYPNIEYIVVDGGSTDNTVEILQRYGDRITWVSEKDGGQADAVNKGIGMAKGSIIGWLNSDDTYLDGAVSKVVEFLTARPRVDMVYGEGYYVDVDGNITGRYATESYQYDVLAERCIICQPAAFFRKEIVDRIGGLDADLQLCMDYELWIRIAQNGYIACISDYLATSRLYQENKTLSRRKDIFREVCSMIKKHYGYLPASWAEGYSDFLCDGTRGKRFKLFKLGVLVWYNVNAPAFLAKFFARYIRNKLFPAKPTIELTGRYTDSWVAKEYTAQIVTRKETRCLVIHGDHEIWPLEQPLKIEIYINREKVATVHIEENRTFSYAVELLEALKPGLQEVKMKMPHTFVPAKYKLSQDTRELSFKLNQVTLE